MKQYRRACSWFHHILFNDMLFFTYTQVQKLQCVPNLPSTEGTQEKKKSFQWQTKNLYWLFQGN